MRVITLAAVLLSPTALAAAPMQVVKPESKPTPAPQHAADSAIRFTDVTAQSGIAFTLTSGATPSTSVLEVKGGGLALIDYDADGDLDLFVPNGATLADPNNGPGARLFRNDGALRFTDVTAASGIAHRRWSFGAAVGDVDGDGRDDLYIACFGPDALLRNKGDGTFDQVKECHTKYRDVATQDQWCRYSVEKWTVDRTKKAAGKGLDDKPTWPDAGIRQEGSCLGCEREGKRSETYTVLLTSAGDQKEGWVRMQVDTTAEASDAAKKEAADLAPKMHGFEFKLSQNDIDQMSWTLQDITTEPKS